MMTSDLQGREQTIQKTRQVCYVCCVLWPVGDDTNRLSGGKRPNLHVPGPIFEALEHQ
jgi:hypothetical protein